jgi:hypothetical protein
VPRTPHAVNGQLDRDALTDAHHCGAMRAVHCEEKKMLLIGTIFGIFAAGFHLLAYALYGRNNFRGRQPMNVATWALWVILSWLNAATYLVMSGDWSKSFAIFAGASACSIVFALAIARKTTSRVDTWDAFIFVAGLIAATAWWHWRDATLANLILQAAITISMIPTYRRILTDAAAERPAPWFLWGTAYAFVLGAVIFRWHGRWADLAYPVMNGTTHFGIGLIAFFGKKSAPPR